MVEREFLQAVINANISDEMNEYATAGIAKLDARNAKRKATPSKAAVANEPIKVQITEFLGTVEAATAMVIADKVGITTAKAVAVLGQMDNVGSRDIKVPKVGTRKAWFLVPTEGEEA